MRTSTALSATSWPRTTGTSATRPSTRAAMSNRVASASPCTSRGSGRTRYQIDKAATATITTPTMMDGTRVDEDDAFFIGALTTALGSSDAARAWMSGFGISIAHSAELKSRRMIRPDDDPLVTSIIFSARGLLHRRRTKVIELHGQSNVDGGGCRLLGEIVDSLSAAYANSSTPPAASGCR